MIPRRPQAKASNYNFALDLREITERLSKELASIASETVFAIGRNLVNASPVGNPSIWKNPPPPGYVGGHFRANWQYGYNFAQKGVIPDIDNHGAATTARIRQGISVSPPAGVHFLANNLPYARALEYGWSRQAPQGMVGITVAEFEDWARRAVAAVRGGTP